ncbi:unnamed protein product [Closterium sp. Yama58-4]|nr:unnamed protein product [Closterium sp. Yama58-4]
MKRQRLFCDGGEQRQQMREAKQHGAWGQHARAGELPAAEAGRISGGDSGSGNMCRCEQREEGRGSSDGGSSDGGSSGLGSSDGGSSDRGSSDGGSSDGGSSDGGSSDGGSSEGGSSDGGSSDGGEQ